MAEAANIQENDLPSRTVEGRAGLLSNLLGPVSEDIGLILGQLSEVLRFYSEQNLSSVFKKWAEQRQGRVVDAEEFKRVMPLLRMPPCRATVNYKNAELS
jgi:hypothetical protein